MAMAINEPQITLSRAEAQKCEPLNNCKDVTKVVSQIMSAWDPVSKSEKLKQQ